MKHRDELQNGVRVLSLAGEVDISSAPELRKLILNHVLAGEAVLVDLSAVGYIDSSGIASLVEGHQAARRIGGSFGLLQPSEPVMGVLRLARLDRVFALHQALPVVDR